MIYNNSSPRRIAIAGASGRMGRMLIEAVLQAGDTQLAGAFDMPPTRCANGHRHHRVYRRAKGRDSSRQPRDCYRHGAQYERGRECHAQIAGAGSHGAEQWLRH